MRYEKGDVIEIKVDQAREHILILDQNRESREYSVLGLFLHPSGNPDEQQRGLWRMRPRSSISEGALDSPLTSQYYNIVDHVSLDERVNTDTVLLENPQLLQYVKVKTQI